MSIPFTGKQLNKQKEKKRTSQDDDDDEEEEEEEEEYYIIVDQQKSIDQLAMMNKNNEIDDDDDATKLYDNGQHDGIYSDESQYSDDFRLVRYQKIKVIQNILTCKTHGKFLFI